MTFHTNFYGFKLLWVLLWVRFCFDKIDGFNKIYDGIKYLELFSHNWNDEICDRIKYLISRKSGITDTINHTLQESELIHFILYLLKKY